MQTTAIQKQEAPEVGRHVTHGGGYGVQAYAEVGWQMLTDGSVMTKEGFADREKHVFNLDIGNAAAMIWISTTFEWEYGNSSWVFRYDVELDEFVLRDEFEDWNPTFSVSSFAYINEVSFPVYYLRGGKAELSVSYSKDTSEPITWLDTQVMVYVADLPSKEFRELNPPGLVVPEEAAEGSLDAN